MSESRIWVSLLPQLGASWTGVAIHGGSLCNSEMNLYKNLDCSTATFENTSTILRSSCSLLTVCLIILLGIVMRESFYSMLSHSRLLYWRLLHRR